MRIQLVEHLERGSRLEHAELRQHDDSPAHNVTYVSGPKFTSSGTMNNGDTFKLKLTQAGTIHYFCSIHPFMKATIVVTP